jgi:hypothetical protein
MDNEKAITSQEPSQPSQPSQSSEFDVRQAMYCLGKRLGIVGMGV